MAKKLLIVKATDDLCAAELDQLEAIAGMFSIEPTVYEFSNVQKFVDDLGSKETYDYVYLGAHANPYEFGDSQGKIRVGWNEFGLSLCTASCLEPECVVLLGCCRGGLKPVAKALFGSCAAIDYVCGPRWTVRPSDITLGFHVFIYNMESRKEQPSVAVARASQATGYDFFCYDRVEMEDNGGANGISLEEFAAWVVRQSNKT